MPPKKNDEAENCPKPTVGRTTRRTAAGNAGLEASSRTPNISSPPSLTMIGRDRGAYYDFGQGRHADIERHRQKLIKKLRAKEKAVMVGSDKMRTKLSERHTLQAQIQGAPKDIADVLTKSLRAIDGFLTRNSRLITEWKEAVALYEDFMYYQNPRYRQHFCARLQNDATTEESDLAKKIGDLPPVLFSSNENYNMQMAPYVQGMRLSHVGVVSRLEERAIHQELHLRTPVWRRRPCGVGRLLERPRELSLEFDLNDEQIEKRRLDVDSRLDDGTRQVKYRSHQARRDAQCEHDKLKEARYKLERLQTPGGLYISAREDSDDWPTSYDYQGNVKNSFVAEVPARIESRPGSGNTDHFEFLRSPKRRKLEYKYYVTTAWEGRAMPGRQERHTDNLLSPTSAIGSPSSPRGHIDIVIPEDTRSSAVSNELRSSSYDDDADSDGEGDLFAASYREGVGNGKSAVAVSEK